MDHSDSLLTEDTGAGLAARIKLVADQVGKAALSRHVGVSETQMFRYIKQKNEPRVSILVKMARASAVNLEWLATGSGPMRQGQVEIQAELDEQLLRIILEGLESLAQKSASGFPPPARARFVAGVYRRAVESIDDSDARLAMVDSLLDGLQPLLLQGGSQG